jgi:hypothetical protein
MTRQTDTTSSNRPESVEQLHAQFLREALEERAAKLRRLGDTFDRFAADVDSTATYSRLAENALHELTWGIANLNVGRLINEAASADVARAKGE